MTKSLKIIAIIFVVLFIISLVPILFISHYNHMSADDYSNAYQSVKVWNETGSINKLIESAAQRSYSMYQNWQGTYVCTFLVPLQPGIFGEEYYPITTYIMVFSFILGYLFFTKKLLMDLLKLNITHYLIISIMMITISIQLVPYAVSAFYWFNGSILYTFGYAIFLVLLGLAISIIQSKKRWKTILYTILACLCAFIVGGENFVTALLSPIILGIIMIAMLFKKNKHVWKLTPVLVVATIFLLVSILAPGNSKREAFFEGLGPITTIAKSMFYGLIYISRAEWNWMMAPASTICFSLAVIPFLMPVIKRKDFSYRYPLLVIILSLCVFSAQFAPTIYTTGGSGPYRLKNVIYYTYVFLLVFNLTYVCGWIYKKLCVLNADNLEGFEKKFDIVYKKTLIPFMIVILAVGSLLLGENIEKTTTINARLSIAKGIPQQYANEHNERMIALNSDEKDIVLNEFSVKPYLLYFDDITFIKDDWRNKCVANFYGKDSIILK